MSDLSLLLKKFVGFLAINSQDAANLHDEIDAIVPNAVATVAGLETSNAAIQNAVLPLLSNVVSSLEGKLVGYVENRLSGAPASTSMPDTAVVPAPVDPDLVSAAPSETILAATAGQAAVGLAAPVLVTDDVTSAVVEGQTLTTAPTGVVETAPVVTAPTEAAVEVAKIDPSSVTAAQTPVALADDAAAKVAWRAQGFKFDPVTGTLL